MAEHAPPGWYDGGDGQLRWWDGTTWTAVAPHPPHSTSSSDESVLAIVAHISPLVGFSFIGPLIVYLIVRNDPARTDWVRDHAREALNFQLGLLVVSIVSVLLTVILTVLTFGIALIVLVPLWIVLVLGSLVLSVLAAIAAGRREAYRYPVSMRFLRS